MFQTVKVLVVIPTLGDRLEYLEQALGSVRSQAVKHVDLVVVAPENRGVEELAAAFDARFVVDRERSGISSAINAGLQSAERGTEYFTWLGDDDLLLPGSLTLTTGVLDSNPGAAMAYGWCDYIDSEGDVVFRSRAGDLARRILRFGPNLIPQPGSLMRLRDVMEVGGLDETLRFAMDLDLYLRLRGRGRLVSLPQTLAAFRWHEDSTTVSNTRESMDEADRVRMRHMNGLWRSIYPIVRWPGRFALTAARQRATRNARK